jgi:hypothetical protein
MTHTRARLQCLVVLMALTISLGFLVYGTRLVLVLYRTEAVNNKFSKLRRSKTIKVRTHSSHSFPVSC